MLQSRSKKTQPREAWRPFVSVISELREIIVHQKRPAGGEPASALRTQ